VKPSVEAPWFGGRSQLYSMALAGYAAAQGEGYVLETRVEFELGMKLGVVGDGLGPESLRPSLRYGL